MYAAGLPVLLFFILAIWGLKDGEVTWLQVGIAFLILVVSFVAVVLLTPNPIPLAVPAVIIDIWLLYKLDILSAPVH